MAALVLLSGGADSTICAAIARKNHAIVHAVTVDYGQRHNIEVDSAIAVASALELDSHEVITLPQILKGVSPLVSDRPVDRFDSADGLPDGVASTFVPNRNAFFLMLAANRAIVLGAETLWTGVCQTDYSGYPDCRRVFIDAMEAAIALGNECELSIVTPLMNLTKAQSVLLGMQVLGDRFDDVMSLTHTCYEGVKGGCGHCAACLLRDRGFKDAGVADPIWQFRGSAVCG